MHRATVVLPSKLASGQQWVSASERWLVGHTSARIITAAPGSDESSDESGRRGKRKRERER